MWKKFLKQNISLMIVFTLLLSFASPALSFAEDTPSVDANITVRIELDDHTLIPPTRVHIDDLDLSDYPGINKTAEDYNSLKPIHAIVKALEQNGRDPKDQNELKVGFNGDYIHSIGGIGEFDKGPMSGWKYFVDNKYANTGVGNFEIKDGQEVVMFYIVDYTNYTYSWFEDQSFSVDQNKNFTLKLNGSEGGFGINPTTPVNNATILIDEDEFTIDGEIIRTNEQGEATLNIDEPGTYHISARLDEDEPHQLIRPYASVTVKEIIDEITRLESIDSVDTIKVDYGTEEDSVISSLPKTTSITDSNGQKHTVTLNWKVLDYKNNKAGKYDATATFELPDGIHQSEPEAKLEVSTKIIVKEKPVSETPELKNALDKLLKYYDVNPATDPDSDWESFVGLWGAGKNLRDMDYDWRSIEPNFEATIYGNQHIRYIFSLLGIGENPSNIWANRNLFAELSSHLEEYNGQFGTIGKHIFAIKALDIGEALDADVGYWNNENKDIAIQWLLNEQNDDGAFGSFSKLDHTGWAIMALSNHKDKDGVEEAIDKALDYLESKQIDSGSFVDASGWGSGENSNTNACVIQGLVAIGEDVTNPNGRWATDIGNTPVDGLLQFQQNDGSFRWEADNEGDLNMATKQSLIALVDLINGKSTWHRIEDELKLDSIDKEGFEEQVEELNKSIDKLPNIKNINLDNKSEIMKVYNSFMQLPDEYKAKVDDADLLLKLKDKIDGIEEEIKAIDDAIWDLPGDVEDIKLEDKDAILDIISRYEALSEEDRKYVEHYDEVIAAMEKIKELEKEQLTNTPKDENTGKEITNSEDKDKTIDDFIAQTTDEDVDEIDKIEDTDVNPKTGDNKILIALTLFILSISTLAIVGFKKTSKSE